jgi:thiol peroxidase
MSKIIKFKGNSLTLVGRTIKTGNIAPDFRVVSQDLKEVSLSDFSRSEINSAGGIPLPAGKGKIKVITSFPSLDTPVCDLQVKEFNEKASGVSSEVVILGISKDLPFAQKRFCQVNDIKNVTVLSDYKFSSFGINYGLLIKDLNLLARAVVILDKNNLVRYIQIVEELTTPPDYKEVLSNLEEVIKNPAITTKEELPSKCKPCEEGTPPMPKEKVEKLLVQYRGWQLLEDKKLVKEFKFKDFIEAKYFLDLVSIIAEEQGHHPTFTLIYNKLRITLTTHAAGGLTENDFIMAKIIDELGSIQ